MAKIITQETFNDVVKENIIEFSMLEKEAKEETIKQFEIQGINLANIIMDLKLNNETGEPILNESIRMIENHISGEKILTDALLLENLSILKIECDKSVPHRVLAAKNGTMNLILTLTEKFIDDKSIELLHKCLQVIISLVNKQPDIFDDRTLAITFNILKNYIDINVVCEILQLLSKCCIMHEINRQNIMNSNILIYLKPLIQSDNKEIITNLCNLFRNLILDDDVRVEFGKAHEHARIIAVEFLTELTMLLTSVKDDKDVVCELILTIASLTVRNELCLVVEEAGGLKFILDAMSLHMDSIKVGRESMKLLRALGGNDKVKIHIIQQGAAPLIEAVLNKHKENAILAKVALVCISTLTLRSPENSQALLDTGIAETIMDTLKLHESDKIVQRNGAWAIRNIVSRSRHQCELFLRHGAEEILNAAMKNHPSVELDIKSALRDLECKVNLKEEWTGASEIKIKN